MFNEAEISWTLWCYKDAQFMGMVYPKTESPLMQFGRRKSIRTGRIIRRWDRQMNLWSGSKPGRNLRRRRTNSAILQFRQRGILYRFQTECILKPLLKGIYPEEFFETSGIFQFSIANTIKNM